MADETPKTVTVTALQAHTYHGQSYDVGDTYEIDEGDVTTVAVQGKAARADATDEKKETAPAKTPKRPPRDEGDDA